MSRSCLRRPNPKLSREPGAKWNMRDASLINNTTLATASHSKGMKIAHYPLASLLLLLTLLLDRVHSSSSSSSVAVDAGTPRAVKLETTEERRRTLTEERTNNAAPARRLGSVSEALNGRWLEFRSHSTIPGSDVTPCNQTDGCSPAPMSQPLGTNHAPWTFWATNYTVLTVMEGYYSGESVYHVWDRNASLGNTSRGQPGILCDDDPIECFGDPNVGRGQWILAPGWHSLRITVEYQEYWGDYGWFRLSTNDALLVNATLPAPFNSTVTLPPRVCGSTQAPCSKQTTCCTGLVCRRRPSNPKGNPTCRKCSKRRRRCLKNMDCCGSRPLPVAIPSVASEASSTQSNGTVGQEKRFRVCRRSVMTGPGTCQSCLRQGSHCLHNNDCCSRRCTGATPSTTFCRPARAP